MPKTINIPGSWEYYFNIAAYAKVWTSSD